MPISDLPTWVHKNGHNSACGQYFFLKLAPLYSALTELSIYAKNSILMKISQQSLFLEQVTYEEDNCHGS